MNETDALVSIISGLAEIEQPNTDMSVEDRLAVIEGMLGAALMQLKQLVEFTSSFAGALKGAANNPMIKMMMPTDVVDSLRSM